MGRPLLLLLRINPGFAKPRRALEFLPSKKFPAQRSIGLCGRMPLPKALGARPRRAHGAAQRRALWLNFSRGHGSGVWGGPASAPLPSHRPQNGRKKIEFLLGWLTYLPTPGRHKNFPWPLGNYNRFFRGILVAPVRLFRLFRLFRLIALDCG